MATSIVTQVKSFGIGGSKPQHVSAQVCSIGSKQQTIVVVHQNVGKKVYFKPLTHISHSGYKKFPVIIIDDNILPFITP